MKQGEWSVVIRPKGRSPADEYRHRGRVWIEGRHNSTYTIELVNHGGQRVLAVVSVDGLSVVDGQPASYASPGYVLAPGETLSIPGWKTSPEGAAEFLFGTKAVSYANQTGQGGNEGVIGVAWFTERFSPAYSPLGMYVKGGSGVGWDPLHQTTIASASSGAATRGSCLLSQQTIGQNSLQSLSNSMGTGFGDEVGFSTTRTHFEKASSDPAAVSLLYYDSAANLQRMGIQLRPKRSNGPQAFPGSNSGDYCKPPPSWAAKSWSRSPST